MRPYLADNEILLYDTLEHKDDLQKIPGGLWDKKRRHWRFPPSSIFDLSERIPGILNDPTMAQLLERAKRVYAEADRLKAGKLEPPPHPFLMRHQRVCLALSRLFRRYAFFLDTGTGKTLTSLAIIDDVLNRERDFKWVVVCPKAIIKTAWLEDAKQFFPHLKILPLSKNMTRDDYVQIMARWDMPKIGLYEKGPVAEIVRRLVTQADVFLVNPENLSAALPYIDNPSCWGLIFDESVKLKNPTAQITKQITELAQSMKRVYLLSGKPAPNNNLEYFSQMRIIDPAIFGNNFYRFREKYFNPDYMGYNWTPKPEKAAEFMQRLSRKCVFIAKEDCLDLPDKTYITKEVELPPTAMKYYKSMERQRVLELSENKTIAANQKVVQLMKLRQITSGFVLDDDRPHLLHKHKLNALLETLEEIGDKQVIIWCDFHHEIELIAEALGDRAVTAYGKTKNVDASIEAFKQGRAQYMIAHPRTLKYGVTFVGPSMAKGDCSYAIYYTLSYSYDDYYQSHDRIYRKGVSKPATFIYLVVPGTIDQLVLSVLQRKGELAAEVETYIKRRLQND